MQWAEGSVGSRMGDPCILDMRCSEFKDGRRGRQGRLTGQAFMNTRGSDHNGDPGLGVVIYTPEMLSLFSFCGYSTRLCCNFARSSGMLLQTPAKGIGHTRQVSRTVINAQSKCGERFLNYSNLARCSIYLLGASVRRGLSGRSSYAHSTQSWNEFLEPEDAGSEGSAGDID
jgi:hypothetical protein